MPFLLIVFLMLACLPTVGKDWPAPSWTSWPGYSVLLTWAAVLTMVGWSWWLAWQVRRRLEIDPMSRDQVWHRYERGRRRHQIGLFVMYLGALLLFDWGWAVGKLWTWPGFGVLPGAELLVLAPFLAAMIFSWACFFDADRAFYLATYKLAILDPMSRGLLEQEMPSCPAAAPGGPSILGGRWSFVLFKVRHNLVLVFIPLTLLLLQKEATRLFPNLDDGSNLLLMLLGFGVVLTVFISMPWLVRLVLGLQPLPEGPLRQKLHAAARQMKFRCSNILLWDTHGGMANAMVLGILPWPRYVVFTDKLLAEFTPEEVLAVFGHEVGHIKHHHMLYYLTFLLSSMFVLALLGAQLTGWLPGSGEAGAAAPEGRLAAGFSHLQNHPYLQSVPMMAVVLTYVFVVFGYVSRRCERQADIYGCRAVSLGETDSAGSQVEPGPAGRPLLGAAGIQVFIEALDKVAALNGINREKPGFLQSWQHSTIARRVAFLQRMRTDPAIEPRFQRRVLLLKWGLLLVLGVLLALLLFAQSNNRDQQSDRRASRVIEGSHTSAKGG